MTRKFELAAISISTVTLGAAYLFWGSSLGLAIVIIAGIGWFFASMRSKPVYATYSFVLSILLNFLAANGGASPILMLFSISFSLAAWDLSRFSPQLEKIHPPEAAKRIEKLHLKRLALTLGIGLAVGLAGLWIHIQLQFILALILGLLAFFGLSYLVRSLTAAISKSE
jgi:hypothetical protein